jgi:hypothetical protein
MTRTPAQRRPRQFGTSRNIARAIARAIYLPPSGEALEDLRCQIASRMQEIAEMFVPGVTVTVLVRRPDDDRADICVTNDEFTDLIAMLQRCQAREAGNAGDTVNALEENENGNDTGI